jgi:sugar fermentation stimulation protein A
MPWDVRFGTLVESVFVSRPNRFLVVARLRGRLVRAASRDPGRLRELLVPGASLLLAPSADPRRRTRYTVMLVRHAGRWVSVVPVLANPIFAGAVARGGARGFENVRVVGREVQRGRSRIDFLLARGRRRLLVEVKSVTLVEAGCARFPDAPTARGTRHLRAPMRGISHPTPRTIRLSQPPSGTPLAPASRSTPSRAG